MLQIYMVEEEGYRYWLWEFQGTEAELIQAWSEGLIHFGSPLVSKRVLTHEECPKPWNSQPYHGHIHTPNSSYLYVNGVLYPYKPQPRGF